MKGALSLNELQSKVQEQIEYINMKIITRACQLYKVRQTLHHTIRLLLFMIHHKSNHSQFYKKRSTTELQQIIKKKCEQLFEIDCVLFGGVNLPIFMQGANLITL